MNENVKAIVVVLFIAGGLGFMAGLWEGRTSWTKLLAGTLLLLAGASIVVAYDLLAKGVL